ncbi:hypothetical protein CWC16_10200 [Pseudoalteromonas sp. S3776]|uniref:hypothetical protein n=1 Tax=Pseudoalteromonas sp. S3776 TaxID=579544 RepID=UPI0011093A75|nr:hypothetical protein [Pseudoalteromonas sp. S3776]TMO79963.1 hypothetical protein CWC16_10200 [Pseudoalteromonas sp. S3776]
MEKLILSLVTLGLFFSTARLEAKEQVFQSDDPVFLQASCAEVIEIFDRKQEPGKYAALHTSVSEAMRAGYCIGVLQQYIKSSPSCKKRYGYYKMSNWFDLAQTIANMSFGAKQLERLKASHLLEAAYCNG